ncbi:MAG: hypothetical protein QXQ14_03345 [Candidatus Aenigmatarchaeota archaeon]
MLTNSFCFIIILLLIFLCYNIFNFKLHFSDEIIYANIAWKIKEEKLMPYSEFFYAHPPIHIFLLSIFFTLFPFKTFSLIIFNFLISFLSLLIILKISKKISKYFYFSLIFVIFHPVFILFNLDGTGMELATLFSLLFFYFYILKSYEKSLIFLLLTLLTRYFAALPLLLFLFLENKFIFILKRIYLFLPFFLLLLNNNFFQQTILYHFQRFGVKVIPDFGFQIYIFDILIYFLLFFYSKNKTIRNISFSFLIYYFFLFLLFRGSVYHYFYVPIIFTFLASNLIENKKIGKLIIIIPILNILINFNSLKYYFFEDGYGTSYFKHLESIYENCIKKLNVSEIIIAGNSISVNYLSFIYDLKIVNNMFDLDPKRIYFETEPIFFEKIKNATILIDYDYFSKYSYFEKIKNEYKEVCEKVLARIY